ncbi:MAG: type II 3-dehydroquinate dehydratase [Mycobacteriaceae bacterium]
MMIQILNGPNLGRLGKRQPEVYGSTSYGDLVELCTTAAAELGVEVSVRQTDSESELLDWIHAAADAGDPVVLNAGAFTHTSIALRDACAELTGGLIEVHISNVHAREDFRHHSYLSAVATGVIVGLGTAGYPLAIRFLAERS